ncbi:MAG: hypothetical protein JO144_14370 [Actinobacteria bacterium]|nr:hypothetical protein [Actinomycetota bacterium]
MDLLEPGTEVPARHPRKSSSRPSARFVLLTDLPLRVNRAADVPAPTRVTWRLMAANNRSIGQAGAIFPGIEECLAGIERIRGSVRAVTVSVQFHCGAFSSDGSHWTWTVFLHQVPVATSSHRYKRRLECERALRQFLDAVDRGAALPVDGTPRRLGRRL